MIPEKFFEKVAWPWSRDPVNLSVLNGNSSKMARHGFKIWHACSQGQPGP